MNVYLQKFARKKKNTLAKVSKASGFAVALKSLKQGHLTPGCEQHTYELQRRSTERMQTSAEAALCYHYHEASIKMYLKY